MGCSHDVAGICLGCLYMVCSAIGFVYTAMDFPRIFNYNAPEFPGAICPMLFYALIGFISYLFVLAIIMRRPFLLLPWLALSLFVCYITLATVYVFFEYIFIPNDIRSFSLIITLIEGFVVGVVVNGCVLFVRICREYKQNREAWKRINRESDNQTPV